MRRAGLGKHRNGYALALTADHGVGRIAEQVEGAGRASSRDVGAAIDAALSSVWQPGTYFASSAYTDIYLTAGTRERLERDDQATSAVLAALRATPGIAEAFRADQIAAPELRTSSDPVKRAALFIKMNDMVVQDPVVIPVVYRPMAAAISRKLRATLSGWDNTFWNLKDWYREA